MKEKDKEIETKKSNKGMIALIAVITLAGVSSALIVPFLEEKKELLEMATTEWYYFADGTEPQTLEEKIEILNYMNYEKLNDEMLERYANPVKEYFLEHNKDLNENYHAEFLIRLTNSVLIYNIDVDDNLAKVELKMGTRYYDEIGSENIVLDDKGLEWYQVLRNNKITSYMQNAEGVWVKTTRAPFKEGFVAFNIEEMVNKSLTEKKVNRLPVRTNLQEINKMINGLEEDNIENNSVVNIELLENELGEDFTSKDLLNATGSICFDMETKEVVEINNTHFNLKEFVDNTGLRGKDDLLDYICKNCDFSCDEADLKPSQLKSSKLQFSKYGEVEVVLPEEIKIAEEAGAIEEVEDFNFMIKGLEARFRSVQ